MAIRKRAGRSTGKRVGLKGSVIGKLRKPMAPPLRVEQDLKKYRRAKERERARREQP